MERLQAALVDIALLSPICGRRRLFREPRGPCRPHRRCSRRGRTSCGYLAFLGLLYALYFTGTTGQTLGKMAAGLHVVDAAGRPPGYIRAFVRAAFGACGLLAAGLGLCRYFDPARRAFHDRLLRTRVIKG